MPSYLAAVNAALTEEAARIPGLFQFGENIAQGSRICGLARNLKGPVTTVGNCENTHVGAGLGMMLEGGRALLVVKQLDFLLLGLDQMVNTMNLIRASREEASLGSFTIVAIVCDQGWQGPQSSFHDLAGICSLARVDGYHINGAADAGRVFGSQLARPGFRLIAVSQRRFGEEAFARPVRAGAEDCSELQYAEGSAATIAALGFTLPEACALGDALGASVFQLNPAMPQAWPGVAASAARTGRLIVLDDAKGGASLAHKVASTVRLAAPGCHVTLDTRERQCEYAVNEDRFTAAVA